jgi:hypothetical protein
MAPEINTLNDAYEKALLVYLDAVSDRNAALQEYIRFGAIQDAKAYAAKVQIEGLRHIKYLDLAKRLRLALMRGQG